MVTQATSTQYAAYTAGNGTESDPYVLASNSGTITLESGKYYVLENGATIGTAIINEYNASGSTGGINVNGGHLTIDSDGKGTSVAGKIDMSGQGSSLVLNNDTGKWSYEANLVGEDISAGGDQYYTYPPFRMRRSPISVPAHQCARMTFLADLEHPSVSQEVTLTAPPSF